MNITVYTKPACPQCNATKDTLERNSLAFETIDLTKDADALEAVRALGYSAAPVVIAGNEHWAGFRPDRIKALAETAA